MGLKQGARHDMYWFLAKNVLSRQQDTSPTRWPPRWVTLKGDTSSLRVMVEGETYPCKNCAPKKVLCRK